MITDRKNILTLFKIYNLIYFQNRSTQTNEIFSFNNAYD